jgi:SAM-dependent methyltransferase
MTSARESLRAPGDSACHTLKPGPQSAAKLGLEVKTVAFVKHVRKRYIQPFKRWYLEPWLTANYAGVRVSYKPHLNGGGLTFAENFIRFFRARGMPKQGRVFEWCSGPGFIGFSMLANGLCDSLCLADINRRAVIACHRTIRENGLASRVVAYKSDNLGAIPRSERWDVVVGNPPHFADQFTYDRRNHDAKWRIHRSFFNEVLPFLKPAGVIVLVENDNASTVDTFRSMIDGAGLSIAFVEGTSWEPPVKGNPPSYILGIMRKGDAPPTWARPKA